MHDQPRAALESTPPLEPALLLFPLFLYFYALRGRWYILSGGITNLIIIMAKKKVVAKKGMARKVVTKKAFKKAAVKKATGKKAPAKKANVVKKAAVVKVSLFMKPMQLSADLEMVVGKGPMPRSEVVKRLWAYIRKEGLQDQTNRRNINANENLKKVFGGKATVSMFEMTKLVSAHLS